MDPTVLEARLTAARAPRPAVALANPGSMDWAPVALLCFETARLACEAKPPPGSALGREGLMAGSERALPRRRVAASMLVLGACLGVGAPSAFSQDKYPTRPIELVVPWGPGGGADQLARLVGKSLEPMLGQGVPVINVPGGTGATGMAKLMSSPPDGYSMAIYIADTHALLAGQDARWKMEDITPVAVMIKTPSFIFVPENSPFKSWADFEKEAKANPGKLKVATLGFGSVDDFSLKVLEGKGIKVVQVPFSKPSERYVSILGGHADALYEQAGDVAQFLNGKQMRPILLFGRERSALFKDVPASYELGYEVALPQFRAIVVRSGTPPERVKVLSDALAKVAETPEYKKFLKDQFADEDSFVEAAQAGAYVKGQLDDMKKAMATQ
jgi:tripartite-type tricarboxylate transporter receptor subunit TctC